MIWQPEREIEIVAGTPPGGGLDRSARALLKALTANGLIEVPIKVVNVGGEGGRKAWRHVEQYARDGHVIGIPLRLGNPQQRRSSRRLGAERGHDRALHLAGQFQSRRGSEGDPPCRRKHAGGKDPRVRYRARCGRGRGCRSFRYRRHHGGERRAGA